MKPENYRRWGIGCAAFGFVLIVLNAVDYLTGQNVIDSGITIMGLMLVVVGMGFSAKGK
jgi:hypothetical protein